MKTFVLLVMSAFLLLAPAASAQRFGGIRLVEPPLPNGSACSAEGARCLWGSAGGCSVFCERPAQPSCQGAYCGWLGFPHPGECHCASPAG